MKTVNDKLVRMHGNPGSIQYRMLKSIEDGPANGKIIATPNSVPAVMIEQFATNVSNVVSDIADTILKTFPSQVETMEDLYRHMSDSDHVAIYGAPASTNVALAMTLDTVINANSAGSITAGTFSITIPQYTEVMINSTPFSTYYPIIVEVETSRGSDTTNKVSVKYDISVYNPLFPLADAEQMLEHYIDKVDGIDILTIIMPVYQFKRKLIRTEILHGGGFFKSYGFDDKLYFSRYFSDLRVGSDTDVTPQFVDKYGKIWHELHQIIDNDIYDSHTSAIPCLVVQPDIQNNQIGVNIPPIFLNEDRLGDNLHIEIFTTQGEIELVADTDNPISVFFPESLDTSANSYVEELFNAETVSIVPVDRYIVGGNNGIGFDKLRANVIHGNDGTNTIISIKQMEHELDKSGYAVTRFKDGLTKRIYLANRALEIDNTTIPAGIINTVVKLKDVADSEESTVPLGVIVHDVSELGALALTHSWTLTPNTVYKYEASTNSSSVYGELAGNTNSDIVDEHEDNILTFNPFHTQIDTIGGVALATTYDFNWPYVENILITKDNAGIGRISLQGIDVNIDNTESTVTLRINFESPEPLDGDLISKITIGLNMGGYVGNVELEGAELTQALADQYFEYVFDTEFLVLDAQLYLISDNSISPVNLDGTGGVDLGCYFDSEPNIKATDSRYTFKLHLGDNLKRIFTTVDILAEDRSLPTFAAHTYATHETTQLITVDNAGDPEDGLPYIVKIAEVSATPMYGPETEYTFESLGYAVNDIYSKVKHIAGDLIYLELEDDIVPAALANLSSAGFTTEVSEELYKAIPVDKSIDLGPLDITNRDTWEEYLTDNALTELDVHLPLKEHVKGDPDVDSVYPETATTIYRVHMLHIDNKVKYRGNTALFEGKDVLGTVRDVIVGYCEDVGNMEGRLLENTELYYQPSKTIGYSDCITNSSMSTDVFNLEFGLSIRLHVVRHVAEEEQAMIHISNNIIALVDKMAATGKLSLAVLATQIMSEYQGVITSVDSMGINESMDIQTVEAIDPEVSFNLRHTLGIAPDGTLTTNRALTLQVVPKSGDSR